MVLRGVGSLASVLLLCPACLLFPRPLYCHRWLLWLHLYLSLTSQWTKEDGKSLSVEKGLLVFLHSNSLELVPGSQKEPENIARPGISSKSEELLL